MLCNLWFNPANDGKITSTGYWIHNKAEEIPGLIMALFFACLMVAFWQLTKVKVASVKTKEKPGPNIRLSLIRTNLKCHRQVWSEPEAV